MSRPTAPDGAVGKVVAPVFCHTIRFRRPAWLRRAPRRLVRWPVRVVRWAAIPQRRWSRSVRGRPIGDALISASVNGWRRVGDEEAELLTAVPSDVAVTAQEVRPGRRGLLEREVAGVVTLGVVVELELVEVDHRDDQRGPSARASSVALAS